MEKGMKLKNLVLCQWRSVYDKPRSESRTLRVAQWHPRMGGFLIYVTERSCCDIWKCVGMNVLWQMRYFVSVGRNVTSLLHFDYCYLQGSAWKYPSQRLVHYARKKNWKPYKPPVAVPLAVAVWQADWCSVTGYCSNQRAWKACDMIGSEMVSAAN